MKNKIVGANGSVQNIPEIPQDVKELYKTVWEISQRTIIDMAADRGAFIDQSQSLNIHIAEPTFAKLTSMHFYAWKKVSCCIFRVTFFVREHECHRSNELISFVQGLKTGMYYLRTKPAANAIQFTVDKSKLQEEENIAGMVCSLQNRDECTMCSA